MGTGKSDHNFTYVSITWKLLLMHVYELTLEDPDFRITSREIADVFKCHASNANGLLRKGRSYGAYTRDYSVIGVPHRYLITNYGRKRAEMLIEEQLEKDEFDKFKKDRDEAR